MLIEFNVQNYRSFWETQTLSMTAGSIKELRQDNTFTSPAKGLSRLLRSAVIYGPNGSGKTNLIKALDFMQGLVLLSSKESQEGEKINRKPFLLHSDGPHRPSEFEILIVQDKIRYQYGFTVTNERVTHEWLLAYPENHAQRWFERFYNTETEKYEWYFGPKFQGSKKTWQDATRSNALFLSTAVQLNSEQLKPIFTWFQNLIVIGTGEQIQRGITGENCENEEACGDILEFLQEAGIDVDGIKIKEKKLDEVPFPPDFPDDLKNIIERDIKGKSFKEILFEHQIPESTDTILLPLTEESDGTQKLFAYVAPWLDLMNNGRVMVIDELNNSFHPHLVRFLLKMIHSSKFNKENGQLIFSTHDTSILDSDILRRDQIWFMEKNKTKATRLYPLTDFHPRKKEALEKGYLQGRYGALPYIGEVKF